MNLSKLSILFAILVALSACKEEEPTVTCMQSDWVGSYMGTQECDGTSEALTLNITASGTDAVIIKYEIADSISSVTVEYDPIAPSDCGITYTETDPTIPLTISLDATLDGDKLTLTENFDGDICTVTATRQ
jgi:hypothetical protein